VSDRGVRGVERRVKDVESESESESKRQRERQREREKERVRSCVTFGGGGLELRGGRKTAEEGATACESAR